MKQRWKQYYEENKEEIKEKRKVKQECECGGHYRRRQPSTTLQNKKTYAIYE